MSTTYRFAFDPLARPSGASLSGHVRGSDQTGTACGRHGSGLPYACRFTDEGGGGPCCIEALATELAAGTAVLANPEAITMTLEAGELEPVERRALEKVAAAWERRGLDDADRLLRGLEAIARLGGDRRERLVGLLEQRGVTTPASSGAELQPTLARLAEEDRRRSR